MSCNTLTGIPKGCDNNIGGIKKFYVGCFDNSTIVEAGGTVSSISLTQSQTFVEYNFSKNSSGYVEDAAISLENGSTLYSTTTTLVIPRREVAKRNSLALVAAGQQNLLVIVQDANDIYWLQGWQNGANLTAQGEGSGIAKADGSKYALTFLSEEPYQMPVVDPTIIAGLL